MITQIKSLSPQIDIRGEFRNIELNKVNRECVLKFGKRLAENQSAGLFTYTLYFQSAMITKNVYINLNFAYKKRAKRGGYRESF